MEIREYSPSELLGPLNEVEQKNAPGLLYLHDDETLLRSGVRVAIVGARKASDDGLRRARKLARLLTDRGIHVVSGVAEGIDAAAHIAAIEGGGRTIAVLATPLDQSYPAKNKALQEKDLQASARVLSWHHENNVRRC